MYRFLNKELEGYANQGELKSPSEIYRIKKNSNYKTWILVLTALCFLAGILPWTQNIRSKGYVTTINQRERLQELNSILPGKIDKWYVKEGDFVKKGDLILQMSEVKAEYLDPRLIERTQQQIEAKNQSQSAYLNKAGSIDSQIMALESAKVLKLQSLDNKISQQKLKVISDSLDRAATLNAFQAYERQFIAAKTLLDSGAISLTEFEKRRINLQDGKAKFLSQENKLNQAKQELQVLRIEKNATVQDYLDKISKASGDKFAAISDANSSLADMAKLENLMANYNARNQLFTVRAPQDGQIAKVLKAGIGEILKEGEVIAHIVPLESEKAVEIFVEPVDLPLISLGQNVRFVFDGFPAIVFSGWPSGSYGTFGGKVRAIENAVSENGKFRVLVAEDPSQKPWPKNLKLGGGANGIALLSDVRVFYKWLSARVLLG
jgi:multidrug efflux pump subunit AcrA (membrane-fusion protein)